MNILVKLLMVLLSLLGLRYIYTLLVDGAKLQKFRRKYYTIYSTSKEETDEDKLRKTC